MGTHSARCLAASLLLVACSADSRSIIVAGEETSNLDPFDAGRDESGSSSPEDPVRLRNDAGLDTTGSVPGLTSGDAGAIDATGCQPGDRRACVNALGVCADGVQECSSSGTYGPCSVQPGTRDCRSPFDNDCDGLPDDTLDEQCRCIPGSEMACDVPPSGEVGICSAGRALCVAASRDSRSDWGQCTGAQAARARDCSSPLDNDCNGVVDGTECDCVLGQTRPCGSAPGSFGCSPGTETCVEGSNGSPAWGECEFVAAPDQTVCNDENVNTVGDACQGGACLGFPTSVLARAESFTCAVTSGGGVSCWGDLDPSAAGGEALGPRTIAASGFVGVSGGSGTACAVRPGGEVECFLNNEFGERGNGAPSEITDFLELTPVSSLDDVVQISTGFRNTAAVDSGGLVWVWGEGELLTGSELFGPVPPSLVIGPVGDFETVPVPHRVRSLGSVAHVSVGTFHACALRFDGSVACWGNSVFGQLGVPGVSASSEPLEIQGLQPVTQVSSGFGTCVVESSGSVKCWGISCPGGVFDAFCAEPVEVPGISDAVQVVTNSGSCVLLRSGQVLCWGDNTSGALGDGSTVDSITPRPVTGLSDAVLLASGGRAGHHCAVRRNGQVVCWGSNTSGQLGDGTTTNRTSPVAVQGLAALNL